MMVTFPNVKYGFEHLKSVTKISNFSLTFSNIRHQHKGYIDVGDGCWRPNVLVTSLRCWWLIQVTDLIHWENHQHNGKSRQHNDSITNISNRLPSSSHQHNDVTNITMSPTSLSPNINVTEKILKFHLCWNFLNFLNLIISYVHAILIVHKFMIVHELQKIKMLIF